jgi:NADH-quinone oxidoreductase subunit H
MSPMLIVIAKVLAGVGLMLVNGVVLIYMLRKVLGHLHVRLGPMHVGWKGSLQTVFDVVKLVSKEDIVPRKADRWLYRIAPLLVFVPSLLAYAPLAFSGTWRFVDLDTGLLFVFAALSLVPLGVLMGGWASSNKYSLLGGVRSAAQQIAYEVPLLLSVIGVVMIVGSLNMTTIVEAQQGYWLGVIPRWFIGPQLPAFILFLVAALADLNQTPFDLSEAESELVTGFANEYGAMKFGLFFLSEFSNTFIMSALAVTVFFGGWYSGLPGQLGAAIDGPVVFLIKTYLMIFVLMWIRGTFPRVRIDQLMTLGWKVLIPAALVWIAITGVALKLVEVAV